MRRQWGPAPVFLSATAMGLLAALVWLWLGERWEVPADGQRYMALYEGRLTEAPFAYRWLTPALARLLPWSATVNFSVVTIGSLSLATGFVALLGRSLQWPTRAVLLTCLLWISAFAFVYYGTTRVRADGPMLMLMPALFLAARARVSIIWLALIMLTGCMAHETMLVCLPLLWLDKRLALGQWGGQHYRQAQLLGVGALCLAAISLTHHFTPIAPAVETTYVDGPRAMLVFTLKHTGGPVKHLLRLYAGYGPALLYAIAGVAAWRQRREAIALGAMLLLVATASLMATDTLRIMAIVYVPVLLLAARWLEQVWQSQGAGMGASLVGLQLAYAGLVYGHLRSFKASHSMNLLAAGLSALAMGLIAWALWRQRRGASHGAPTKHLAASA